MLSFYLTYVVVIILLVLKNSTFWIDLEMSISVFFTKSLMQIIVDWVLYYRH